MTEAAPGGFTPSFQPADGDRDFRPLWAEGADAAGFQPLQLPASAPEAPRAARPEAREALQRANEQAAAILAAAEARAAAETEARVAAAVEAEREAQAEAFRGAAQELLTALREQAEARLKHIEREAAGLVTTIARRLLREHFMADEAAIVPVVREALRPFADAERVQVIIAPQHQPALREAHEELVNVLRESAQLEIVPVETAEPYGCVVHGDDSSVDARLETRLHAIGQALDQTIASDTAA